MVIERPGTDNVLRQPTRLQRGRNLHQRRFGATDTKATDDVKDHRRAHAAAQRRRHDSYIRMVQRA